MGPLKCLIVDDEPIAHSILKQYIDKDERIEFAGSCSGAVQALQFLQQNKDIGLIFLDIKMPKISGIEFLKSLRNPPHVVFTTANREYAIEGFDLNAVDYLLKPFSFERFLQAVNKVVLLEQSNKAPTGATPLPMDTQEEEVIVIKADGRLIQLKLSDIFLVEALKEYVKIHTDAKVYITHQSMASVEEKLPARQFVRSHRSFIVALRHINNIEGNIIRIKKLEIPISRERRDEVIEKFTQGKMF